MTLNTPLHPLILALSLCISAATLAQPAGSVVAPLDVSLEIASGRFSGALAVAKAEETPDYRTHTGDAGRSGWTMAYPLASVTKVFTGTAVLALHEQGQLDLDAPLARLLPALADRPAGRVTVRQLLDHSSGIPSVMQTGQGLDATLDPTTFPLPSTLDAQLAPALALDLRFEPGTRYEYNNSGYLLLAKVIEAVTGKPYPEAIAALVLRPAGIEAGACFCSDVPGAIDVEAREWQGEATVPAVAIHPTRSASAGGLRMTPEALATWLQALAAGRILKPDTLALAWRPGRPTRRSGESMGLGWLVREEAGRIVVLHDGALPGATAAVAIDTAAKTVALGVLSPTLPLDRLSVSQDYLRERVVALLADERPSELPRAVSTPLPALAGDYALPDGRRLTVAHRDDGWRITLTGGGSPLEVPQAVRRTTPATERAVAAATALLEQGQAALVPFLSEMLKAQLPPTALDGLVADWKTQHGEVRSIHAFGVEAGGRSVHLRLQFERGAVDIGFNYTDGKLAGLQLLGGSREDLPTSLAAWPAAGDSLWMDGYGYGAAPVRLFAVLEEGRVVGLTLDPAESSRGLFPRVP